LYPFRAITTFALLVRTKLFFQKTKDKVMDMVFGTYWTFRGDNCPSNLRVARLMMTHKLSKTQKAHELLPFRAIMTFVFQFFDFVFRKRKTTSRVVSYFLGVLL
jgi:hypothetical protein